MSVFSDHEIRAAHADGHIVLDPFVSENVRGSSVDLTLGENYYTCGYPVVPRHPMAPREETYNPFDRDDVERYFQGPYKATPYLDLVGIPDDHPTIMLRPRARILAHTHEFAGIRPPGTSEMRARSTWGRNGIQVCACAGWGDPGYIGRWTMEIANLNDYAVPLPVGERVCQLIFHETGEVDEPYVGKYQQTASLYDLVKDWEPESMLPRAYKDERRLPDALAPDR